MRVYQRNAYHGFVECHVCVQQSDLAGDTELVVKILTHSGIVIDELLPERCPMEHAELLLGA